MSIKDELGTLFLVGDIFDYWFEYKSSVPSGYSDFFTALKILRNEGVEITFFSGNHDMWMFKYFTEEYGITIYHKPQIFNFDNKRFFIGHGDGLGPGDLVYKIIKSIFRNSFCQWCFSLIHPTVALGIMRTLSQRDSKKYVKPDKFEEEKEWLIQFAAENQKTTENVDYYIFGHRHLMYDYDLGDGARVINLGDWISFLSYAVWDGETLELLQYKPEKK